ncbi:MAG TPA: hypothetical protein VD996_04385 [Chitinophagaceae bacterium]|nr:hypothetical protein [Chitinophagaceae bacterium]
MISVAIIVNKNWEAEPMLSGMCSNEFRPPGLPFPEVLTGQKEKLYRSNTPRAVFRFYEDGNNTKPVITEVKVWCIEDLMNPSESGSSSEEKYRVLPPVIARENPNLVIAAGTAGYLGETSYAGCVLFGGRFFVYNGNSNNPRSRLTHPDFEKLLPFNVNPAVFGLVSPAFKQKTEPKLLRPPVHPAVRPAILASQYYTAISSVNVTDYGEYAWVDEEALHSFRNAEKKLPVGSLETTHGVIRLSSALPCIFVSAITDRIGHFEMEVIPSQNYICSFNMGIVLAQFIADLNEKQPAIAAS